jgi:hypothetical protein
MGADVDELACSLHRPMVCGLQTSVQNLLRGAALSYHTVVGSGAIPRGAKLLGLYI